MKTKKKKKNNNFSFYNVDFGIQPSNNWKNKPNNCKLFYSAGTCEHYVSNLSHLFLKKNFAASPYWIEK